MVQYRSGRSVTKQNEGSNESQHNSLRNTTYRIELYLMYMSTHLDGAKSYHEIHRFQFFFLWVNRFWIFCRILLNWKKCSYTFSPKKYKRYKPWCVFCITLKVSFEWKLTDKSKVQYSDIIQLMNKRLILQDHELVEPTLEDINGV